MYTAHLAPQEGAHQHVLRPIERGRVLWGLLCHCPHASIFRLDHCSQDVYASGMDIRRGVRLELMILTGRLYLSPHPLSPSIVYGASSTLYSFVLLAVAFIFSSFFHFFFLSLLRPLYIRYWATVVKHDKKLIVRTRVYKTFGA